MFNVHHKFETLYWHVGGITSVGLHNLSESFLHKFLKTIAPRLKKALNDFSFARRKDVVDASAKAEKEQEENTLRKLKALGL